MADTTIELPARPFAAAWLNVSRAAADDPDRPQLYRSVIVELLDDHSVRLVSTDSFMLLRSHVRLDHDQPNWLGHVTDHEHPYLTITALDWDHRAQALLKYALKATKDDPTALIHLSIVNLEEPDVPTLTEDLNRMGLSIEFQNERLVLDLFDADPITWRPLFENREPAACDQVAYNPEFLARLAGAHTVMPTTLSASFGLAGPLGISEITVDVEPPLVGGLMPVRIGE